MIPLLLIKVGFVTEMPVLGSPPSLITGYASDCTNALVAIHLSLTDT